jgi:hypothetical protein
MTVISHMLFFGVNVFVITAFITSSSTHPLLIQFHDSMSNHHLYTFDKHSSINTLTSRIQSRPGSVIIHARRIS